MSKITKAWIDAQIEHEMERGTHQDAIRDLAALITVRKYICGLDEGDAMTHNGVRYAPAIPTEIPDDHLTREEAEKWVSRMQAHDGHKGGRWTLGEVRQYAHSMGVTSEDDIIDYYALLNAMYTDYSAVAKKYGVDRSEFYFDMAKAFLHDDDAVPDKLRVYMEHIAKHDD